MNDAVFCEVSFGNIRPFPGTGSCRIQTYPPFRLDLYKAHTKKIGTFSEWVGPRKAWQTSKGSASFQSRKNKHYNMTIGSATSLLFCVFLWYFLCSSHEITNEPYTGSFLRKRWQNYNFWLCNKLWCWDEQMKKDQESSRKELRRGGK